MRVRCPRSPGGTWKRSATTKDFLAVQTEGKRNVQRSLKYYNLDMMKK
jgi:hypothetical protein